MGRQTGLVLHTHTKQTVVLYSTHTQQLHMILEVLVNSNHIKQSLLKTQEYTNLQCDFNSHQVTQHRHNNYDRC